MISYNNDQPSDIVAVYLGYIALAPAIVYTAQYSSIIYLNTVHCTIIK